MTTDVLWFRRDLRLHDHLALVAAAGGERLAPLFVLDEALLGGEDTAPNRIWFMVETLRGLAADLEALGSRLHVRAGRPEEVVPAFAREAGADAVHVSRDFTPYGRRRDERVARRLQASQPAIAFRRHAGVLVHEPEALATQDGRHYTVYSPFRRSWDELAIRSIADRPAALPPPPDGLDAGVLPPPGAHRPTAAVDLLPAPGETAARARLDEWLARGIGRYQATRDRLGDETGTSRLSQDLRFGLLSAAEVASRAEGAGEGRRRFVAELCWRDFYAHVLWHEPELLRRSFRPEMDAAFSAGDPALIDAWRDGRTGYPLVDAAMRQLAASGWMHNRGRMISASFLTKHLLIDRRVGEAHFWRHLVDGDQPSNNGGWQWAASTGTDPQPFFRIFNPILQGKRFDPSGTYVRRWLPELARVPDDALHEPWTMSEETQREAGCVIGRDYPTPIVDHRAARDRALGALADAGSPGRRDPVAEDRRDGSVADGAAPDD